MDAVVDSSVPTPLSAEQITLPDASVVNFPPLPKTEQSYAVSCRAEPTETEAPKPTLPEKVWAAVHVLEFAKFSEATTAPVVGEIVKVPSELETELIKLVTVEVSVSDPPKETSPPPDNPEPVLIVTLLLDRAELGILVKVLEEPDKLLLVKV